MEESEKDKPKNDEKAPEQNNQKNKSESVPEDKNLNIYEQYQKEKINSIQKDEKSVQKNNSNSPDKSAPPTPENELSQQNEEKDCQPQEKVKRRRRGKNEIKDRKFQCPECEKCYLSGPALTTHRKTKHGNGGTKEKKRGRPKKDDQTEGKQSMKDKFDSFFNADYRKRNNQENQGENKDEEKEEKNVDIEKIKSNIKKIFEQCKEEVFKDIENIDKYSFYNFIIENWEKEDEKLFPPEEKFCFNAQFEKGVPPIKLESYNLDQLFFLYYKEFAKLANDDYLWFITKFIVLFRECINAKWKNLIKAENISENRTLYSQIYNAETVPEICNDFFLEFLQPYNNFGLDESELIKLIQHFCYWLYKNDYTKSQLTLLDDEK